MKDKTQINSVDMVRRIRDKQTAMLEGKSNAEIMAFFKQAGEVAKKNAKLTTKSWKTSISTTPETADLQDHVG